MISGSDLVSNGSEIAPVGVGWPEPVSIARRGSVVSTEMGTSGGKLGTWEGAGTGAGAGIGTSAGGLTTTCSGSVGGFCSGM